MIESSVRWQRLPVFALTLLVAACATPTSREPARVPVEEQSGPASIPPLARAPVPEAAPPKPANPAVESLLAQALVASKKGDQAGALSLLERAQRIEPRNALVWNRMALARLQQGEFAQAESLALKSNLYAAGNSELQVRNWRVIAEARRNQGDAKGARDAERRAQTAAGGG